MSNKSSLNATGPIFLFLSIIFIIVILICLQITSQKSKYVKTTSNDKHKTKNSPRPKYKHPRSKSPINNNYREYSNEPQHIVGFIPKGLAKINFSQPSSSHMSPYGNKPKLNNRRKSKSSKSSKKQNMPMNNAINSINLGQIGDKCGNDVTCDSDLYCSLGYCQSDNLITGQEGSFCTNETIDGAKCDQGSSCVNFRCVSHSIELANPCDSDNLCIDSLTCSSDGFCIYPSPVSDCSNTNTCVTGQICLPLSNDDPANKRCFSNTNNICTKNSHCAVGTCNKETAILYKMNGDGQLITLANLPDNRFFNKISSQSKTSEDMSASDRLLLPGEANEIIWGLSRPEDVLNENDNSSGLYVLNIGTKQWEQILPGVQLVSTETETIERKPDLTLMSKSELKMMYLKDQSAVSQCADQIKTEQILEMRGFTPLSDDQIIFSGVQIELTTKNDIEINSSMAWKLYSLTNGDNIEEIPISIAGCTNVSINNVADLDSNNSSDLLVVADVNCDGNMLIGKILVRPRNSNIFRMVNVNIEVTMARFYNDSGDYRLQSGNISFVARSQPNQIKFIGSASDNQYPNTKSGSYIVKDFDFSPVDLCFTSMSGSKTLTMILEGTDECTDSSIHSILSGVETQIPGYIGGNTRINIGSSSNVYIQNIGTCQ